MPKPALKHLLQKEMSRKDFLRISALATISLIGIGGLLTELLSHAASPYAAGEAENGKLTGPASVTNDTTASGGKAVEFGKNSTGGGGTGGNPVPTVPSGTTVPSKVILNSTWESPGNNTTTLEPYWVDTWGQNDGSQNPNAQVVDSAYTTITSDGVQMICPTTSPSSAGLICTQSSGQQTPFTFTPSASAPVFVEFKAYIPCQSDGTIYNWPALWVVTPDTWNAEIDIFEGLGGSAAAHYHFNNGANQAGLSYHINPNADNVFGLLFANTGTAEFFVNGESIGSLSPPVLSSGTLSQTNGFQLVAENSNGSTATGPTDTSAVLILRYARVWQD